MSVGSDLIGKVFLATQVSEGTTTGSGTGPYTFTETRLLSDQQVFGTPIGPNATATVTGVSTANGTTTITVLLGNTTSFANGQQVTGVLLANDTDDFLLFGSNPALGSVTLYVTNTPNQQPGVNNTVTVAGESSGVAYTPPCFCAGTLIQTQTGETPVEDLAIGDTVATASGGTATVRWIGWRKVDLAAHPHRADVQPIRIKAGAFGARSPASDLLLSPEHAVFTDGVLVPAGRLVGCPGVAIDTTLDHTTYYHVELDRHDILLANGLPCESWLDTGNRAMFENAAVTALHFNESRSDVAWASSACARLVTGGPELDAIRDRLGAARPLDLLVAAAGTHRFEVPAGVNAVRVLTQAGRVAGDARVLGAAVCALWLDREPISLSDPRLDLGFHPAEPGWRWTDGAGHVAIGAADIDRVLVVEVSAAICQQSQAA